MKDEFGNRACLPMVDLPTAVPQHTRHSEHVIATDYDCSIIHESG